MICGCKKIMILSCTESISPVLGCLLEQQQQQYHTGKYNFPYFIRRYLLSIFSEGIDVAYHEIYFNWLISIMECLKRCNFLHANQTLEFLSPSIIMKPFSVRVIWFSLWLCLIKITYSQRWIQSISTFENNILFTRLSNNHTTAG